MGERKPIPEGLAVLAPGAELAHALADVDLSRISEFDCVEVLKAQYRQLNHDTARLMATMVEVGLRTPGPDDGMARMEQPDEFSADELRAALVWSRRAAEGRFGLAYDLLTRLPAVHAALDAGIIDEPKARALSEWTGELTDTHAQSICDTVLPEAPGLVTGRLIERIKKLAIAIDPDWARRRYETAVGERKVVGYLNPDGSANLSGCHLPLDQTAVAAARIDALAKAAKRAGHPERIDHLRADLFLGMIDGSYTGLDDTAIVEVLLADARSDAANQPDGDDQSPVDDGGAAADAAGPGRQRDGVAGGTAKPGGVCRSARIELRVRQSTLLGLDELPGELAGWGPVHAELARDLARAHTGGQWRCALTDTDGQLLHAGITRRRPSGWVRTRSAGIVELQVPAAMLGRLAEAPGQLGEWSAVVADLSHHATDEPNGPARLTDDPHRRLPGAALSRQVQIRDRHCRFPTCRAPAHDTDTDHSLDYARGGTTVEANLGGFCRHDHRLKHQGRWRLTQPEPGCFAWTSRVGHRYQVRPPPITEPLPDPAPHTEPEQPFWVPPDDDWDDTTIGPDPDEPQEPSPEPEPAPDPADDPPPF